MDMQKIIDSFMDELFKPEQRRLADSVERLDRENRSIIGSQVWGFMWQGRMFIPRSAPTKSKSLPALDISLRDAGNAMLKDMDMVRDDRKIISQMVYLLAKDCVTPQDFRDAFPDSLVELSSQLSGYARTREVGFTLRVERHREQLQKVLDKIDFYAATRLMY